MFKKECHSRKETALYLIFSDWHIKGKSRQNIASFRLSTSKSLWWSREGVFGRLFRDSWRYSAGSSDAWSVEVITTHFSLLTLKNILKRTDRAAKVEGVLTVKNANGRPRVFNEMIKPEKPVYTVRDAVKRKHQKPSASEICRRNGR